MSADSPGAISRDEVAHLARLARLAVTDRELDLFAGQLDVILGAVARVGEVAGRRHPADLARRAAGQRVPRGRAPPRPDAGAGAGRRARRRGRAFPGAADPGGGGSDCDLTRLTAAAAGREDPLPGGLGRRGRARPPRPDRGRRRRRARVPARRRGGRAAVGRRWSTRALDAGTPPASPLAGVPLALKDVFTTTTCRPPAGSKILEGWRPPYDATVTARLRAAGIVILGKTNMDEFAMGSSTENSAYGPTRNPWDPAGSRAAPAAARPPRSPRSRPRWRSAPTPAARSASPPRSPAPSG